MSGAPAGIPGDADELVVRDNPERRQYEAYLGSTLAGHAAYHSQPGIVTVLHTEVDEQLEGRGVGSALVRGMLDDIRIRDAKVLPVCPFVRAFLQRHPEYTDVVWKP